MRRYSLILQIGLALSLAAPASAAATDPTPVPGDQTFFVRRTNCNADSRLSVEEGTGEASCLNFWNASPLAEEMGVLLVHDAENGVPFTLDTSRPITGVVSLGAASINQYGLGGGLTVVDVTVEATEAGRNPRVLGSRTLSYTATPMQSQWDTPWSIQPPVELHARKFAALRLTLRIHGRNAGHGAVQPNDTRLTVPIYV